MNSTFKIDGNRTLRIINNGHLVDNGESWVVHPPFPYIALIVEQHHGNAPGEPEKAPTPSTLTVMKPHEARAMASVLLSAATEAKQ